MQGQGVLFLGHFISIFHKEVGHFYLYLGLKKKFQPVQNILTNSNTVNQKGKDLDKRNNFKCYQTMVNHLLLCLIRYLIRY